MAEIIYLYGILDTVLALLITQLLSKYAPASTVYVERAGLVSELW